MREILGQVRLSDADIEEVMALVSESGAIGEVLDVARGHARDAQAALAPLADGPAREPLEHLAAYAVERSM